MIPHIRYSYCLLLLIFCWISCQQKESVSQFSGIDDFSDNYRPPGFTEDNRVKQIASLEEKIKLLLAEHIKDRHIPGTVFGVVVDDQLVFAAAAGLSNLDQQTDASSKSVFRIASMTKSFTAMAILILRDQGKLSLEDPVSKYIPEIGKLTYLTKDAVEA